MLCLAGLAGCLSFTPSPLATPTDLQGVQTQTVGDVTVSVAILTDEEARAHFGVDLGKRKIQALWIRVRNGSPNTLWFIRNLLDPNFYPADEAAHLVRGAVSGKDLDRMRQYFRDESMRVLVPAETSSEGFVFLPSQEGGRYVDVRLVRDVFEATLATAAGGGGSGPSAEATREWSFGFAVPLPDGEFDYERLDTERTYGETELPDLDTDASVVSSRDFRAARPTPPAPTTGTR